MLSKQLLSEEAEGDRSGRALQRAQARSRLLNAALDEFVAHGYAGASTRRITSAAGVSSGLLFHHFATKAEIYAELVRFGLTEMRIDLDEALDNPIGYFTDIANRVLAMLRDSPEAARVFMLVEYAQTHPGLVPEVDELLRINDLIVVTVPVIEEGQRRGQIRAGSPLALSLAFWSALQGIAQEVFARPGVDLPEPAWLMDLILRKEGS